MSYMFRGSDLNCFDLSHWNTSNVTNMCGGGRWNEAKNDIAPFIFYPLSHWQYKALSIYNIPFVFAD